MRRIELALLLGGIDREFFQKVFVYATDQVFFLAKLLVADLVDFIDQLFDVVLQGVLWLCLSKLPHGFR